MFWIPVIGWMGLIFFFSSQDGVESGGLSTKILNMILDFFSLYNVNLDFLGFLLRKAAHASIYFVLAVFVIAALIKSSKIIGAKMNVLTVLICFLYACSDELHQWFIPGRAMKFTDVMIDTCGAITALAVFFAISKIYERIKKRKVVL